MHPSSNEQSGFNLPVPIVEQSPVVDTTFEAPRVAETAPLASEADPTRSLPKVTATPPISLPLSPTVSTATVNNDVTKTTNNVVPLTADDGDLIEKEWVNKAKKIVDSTREDPYTQSKELTVFKADYLRKRYNKTIKMSE